MKNEYLDFISDEHFLKCIANLHTAYIKAKNNISKKSFYSNKVDTIKLTFDSKFNSIDEEKLKEVIKNYKFEFKQKINKNKFNYSNGEITFDIEVSTIHKVKGETHTATLVLETFKNDYDLKVLLNLLKGKKRKSYDDKKKLLYVAMSRPTHLLCLAMNKNHLSDEDKKELESCGYIIKDITTP